MKNKVLNQIILIIGIIVITMVLSACSDELHNQKIQQNKAVVSFSVMDSISRSVFPQVSLDDVASYKLLGGRNGADEEELFEFFTESISASLDIGIWNFTLNAYNENNELILQGKEQNKQINFTETNQVVFNLSVLNSGTGNIQITFNFPEDAGITRISTTGDVDNEDFEDIRNGNFVYTKNGITAGDYFINFEFYNEVMLRTVVSELILVRNNLTSEKTVILAGENLKPIPVYEIFIDLEAMDEWELLEQSTEAVINEDKVFVVTGNYSSYKWYLDGTLVSTSSSYTFNKPAGVYQLVVLVTNNDGESRSGRCRIVMVIT